MSNSKTNLGGGSAKRSLPSWMSGKDDGSTSRGKKPTSSGSGGNEVIAEAEEGKQGSGNGEDPISSSLHRDFSKLLVHALFPFTPSVSY